LLLSYYMNFGRWKGRKRRRRRRKKKKRRRIHH
jgi:hypothetical protein